VFSQLDSSYVREQVYGDTNTGELGLTNRTTINSAIIIDRFV